MRWGSDMREVQHEDIVKWVEYINKKFGKACHATTVNWFERLLRCGARVVLENEYYFAYAMQMDAWGDVQFVVLSACSNSVRGFFNMQNAIESKARELDATYIVAGSELDDRYNKWLVKQGYQPFLYKKEL